jgi:hypothetical protein
MKEDVDAKSEEKSCKENHKKGCKKDKKAGKESSLRRQNQRWQKVQAYDHAAIKVLLSA